MKIDARKLTLVAERREDTLKVDQATEIQFAFRSVLEADVGSMAGNR